MHSCSKITWLLLLLFNSSNQDCPEKKPNVIPFIVPITSDEGECHGIIVSRNHILTNAKCVNGSVLVNLQLGSRKKMRNDSTDNIVTASEIILHENFRRVLPTYYQNDLALLKLPSSMNFSLNLRPAIFSTKDEAIDDMVDKIAELVVWKAGHLTTSVAIMQKKESCIRVFGEDFNPGYHFCVLVPDDVFITHIDGSISHPILINSSIVGFAIRYPIADKDGRMYRIMKLSSVIKWVKQYTSVNQDSELAKDLYQNIEDCLFQNISNDNPRNSYLTLKSILQQIVQEEIRDIKKELQNSIDSMQLKVEENVHTLDEQLSKRNADIENYVNSTGHAIRNDIDKRAASIQNFVDSRASKIEEKYNIIQKTLSKKEQQIIDRVTSKFSEFENVLREKDRALNEMSGRLLKLEKEMSLRK